MSMVVLETKDKYAAVLKDDGSILKIFNDNYTVGQILTDVTLNKPRFNWVKPVASIAAAFLVVISLSVVVLKTPTTFVSVDVNPSIEYELNIFNRVVKVSAKNDEGQQIIQNIKITNLPIDVAVGETISTLTREKYLVSGVSEDIVVSCASIMSDSQKMLDEVSIVATASAMNSGIIAKVMPIQSTMDEHKQARQLNTTTGKLALVEQYNQVSNQKTLSQTESMLREPVNVIVMSISAEIEKQSNITTFSTDEGVGPETGTDKGDPADDKEPAATKEQEKSDEQAPQKVGNDDTKDKEQPVKPTDPSVSDPSVTGPSNDKPQATTPKPEQPSDKEPVEPPAVDETPKPDDKQEAPLIGLDDEIDDVLQA